MTIITQKNYDQFAQDKDIKAYVDAEIKAGRVVILDPIVWTETKADSEIQEIAKNAKPWPTMEARKHDGGW